MGYKSIVCGVTGSSHAQKAAFEAASMARENNAKLTYVYAVDMGFLRTGIAVELSTDSAEESMVRLGEHIVAMAAELAASQGVSPGTVVRKGPVLEVLKQVMKEEDADLLVLGHEERTFFEKHRFKGEVEDHVQKLKQETGADVAVIR